MLTEYDDRYDYDEERWQSIGSVKGTLIYVGHTSRIFMKKKLSVSSQPEKLVRVKQEDIVFTEKMQEELRLLKIAKSTSLTLMHLKLFGKTQLLENFIAR